MVASKLVLESEVDAATLSEMERIRALLARPELSFMEEHYCYFEALGVAIATWAEVEQAVFQVVAQFFAHNEYTMLGEAFFTVDSFRAKVGFADVVVKAQVEDVDTLGEWKTLANSLRAQAQTRNKLAHQTVHRYFDEAPGRVFAMHPNTVDGFNAHAQTKPPKGALFLRDMVKVKLHFSKLHCALLNFVARLQNAPAPHPEHRERPTTVPTIADLKRQLHAELGHPLKSSLASGAKPR